MQVVIYAYHEDERDENLFIVHQDSSNHFPLCANSAIRRSIQEERAVDFV